MHKKPQLSIVIPVLDGGRSFAHCLEGLGKSTFSNWELIVVDDGSSDDSTAIAAAHGAKVLRTAGRQGPAAARNLGATKARAQTLVFLDADCEVDSQTLEVLAKTLEERPDLAAVFGSYDDRPVAQGVVSQFRNLLHHHVHQTSTPRVSTFWAGCGAIRRVIFEAVGGFDAIRYPRPAIEDIELGYRVTAAGGRIEIQRDALVRHHKNWGLRSMILADFRDRAAPWTRLLLERGSGESRDSGKSDLNLAPANKTSVVAVACGVGAMLLAPFFPWMLLGVASAGIVLATLQRRFYGFLARRKGIPFLLAAIPLHAIHLGCAGLAFAWVRLCYSPSSGRELTKP